MNTASSLGSLAVQYLFLISSIYLHIQQLCYNNSSIHILQNVIDIVASTKQEISCAVSCILAFVQKYNVFDELELSNIYNYL